MAIRLKKYKHKAGGTRVVRAVRITEHNINELVLYVVRKGGAATGHNGDTASGRPARIRIKQRNYGENWGKKDWRVAKVGDFLVQYDLGGKEFAQIGFDPIEFGRVKEDDFEASFELVK